MCFILQVFYQMISPIKDNFTYSQFPVQNGHPDSCPFSISVGMGKDGKTECFAHCPANCGKDQKACYKDWKDWNDCEMAQFCVHKDAKC